MCDFHYLPKIFSTKLVKKPCELWPQNPSIIPFNPGLFIEIPLWDWGVQSSMIINQHLWIAATAQRWGVLQSW